MNLQRPAPTAGAVGRRIRIQIERYGLTVARAARECDMSVPSLETYLYGKSLPGAFALANLANGLRCSADWLLFGDADA
ncbi:helix-turn-helix domain-containing protein [Tabrizicola fusiformis]|uniref:helix-turn-helix domain-containing protein n=1 Tax=Tabrizicola sp. SY72 TaxID=2741673 RepID=UPI001574CE27|nr:helix-turn-helix domain-containing protein [Tabrizicola sp. SY72]NTT86903.1 hypothetical protein [Tabrizicola sp. SY72]